MSNRKQIIIALTFVVLACLLSGCTTTASSSETSKQTSYEQPHLYWKDVPVTVTAIDRRSWFAGTKWYEVAVSVHSDEYDLDATFTEKGSGFYGCPNAWNYENGDVITAELYTWKIDSANEVVKRRINRIY